MREDIPTWEYIIGIIAILCGFGVLGYLMITYPKQSIIGATSLLFIFLILVSVVVTEATEILDEEGNND